MTPLKGHVLIVDDLASNRNALARLLQKDGVSVGEAQDGLEALEMARRGGIDTILLDVMMPGLDGPGTLAALKQEKELADIPVIMLSAYNESRVVQDCIALGADDFLQKPIDRALLRARLSSCLRRKHLQDREREHLKQLEVSNQELKRLNQIKNRFLAVAAHDLKNPMAKALLLVDQLLQLETDTLGLEGRKQVARRIRDSIHRMLGIVQGLMDTAIYESEQVALRRKPLDLSSLLKFVIEDNRAYAASKRIHLQSFLPPGPMRLEVDEMRIREAVDNLVNNAIKFSPLDHVVEVTLGEDGPWACIRVRDQGPGLTEEDLASLFGPYQRLSAVPTAGEVSIGIGLSIVKQMVELHGGRVWAENGPAKGATFCLALPLSVDGA